MNGVVGGFAALTAVIAVGRLVARTGIVGEDAAAVLSPLFYVQGSGRTATSRTPQSRSPRMC